MISWRARPCYRGSFDSPGRRSSPILRSIGDSWPLCSHPQDPSTSSQEEQKTHFAPATNAQLLEGWERYFVSPSQSATDTADRPFGFARRRRFERPHLTVAMASNVQDRALGPRVSALPARLPGWPPRPPPVLVFALRELSWKCPCIAEQAVVPNAIPAERARFSIACHQKPPSTTGHQHGRPARLAVETGEGPRDPIRDGDPCFDKEHHSEPWNLGNLVLKDAACLAAVGQNAGAQYGVYFIAEATCPVNDAASGLKPFEALCPSSRHQRACNAEHEYHRGPRRWVTLAIDASPPNPGFIATRSKMAGSSADQEKTSPHPSYPPPGNNLYEQPPPVRQRQHQRHRDGLQPWCRTDTCPSRRALLPIQSVRHQGVAGTRPTTQGLRACDRLSANQTAELPHTSRDAFLPFVTGGRGPPQPSRQGARATPRSAHTVVAAHEDAREPNTAPCNNLETGSNSADAWDGPQAPASARTTVEHKDALQHAAGPSRQKAWAPDLRNTIGASPSWTLDFWTIPPSTPSGQSLASPATCGLCRRSRSIHFHDGLPHSPRLRIVHACGCKLEGPNRSFATLNLFSIMRCTVAKLEEVLERTGFAQPPRLSPAQASSHSSQGLYSRDGLGGTREICNREATKYATAATSLVLTTPILLPWALPPRVLAASVVFKRTANDVKTFIRTPVCTV
ncbi:hypothetical protein ACCO45_010936 [Purpureocillium lilacinum]|uniref:Uncharacterized protein n=1 Tax=Purpureocillium lilacinum TaxID=33203 RepID=A0ACC4DJ95_PURLI